MLHRARSRGLVDHGPGEPCDALGGGVSSEAPGLGRRARRRGRGGHGRWSGITGRRPRRPTVAERVPSEQPDDQPGSTKNRRAARRPPVGGGKPPGAPDPQRPAVMFYDVVLASPVHSHATTVTFSAARQQPPVVAGRSLIGLRLRRSTRQGHAGLRPEGQGMPVLCTGVGQPFVKPHGLASIGGVLEQHSGDLGVGHMATLIAQRRVRAGRASIVGGIQCLARQALTATVSEQHCFGRRASSRTAWHDRRQARSGQDGQDGGLAQPVGLRQTLALLSCVVPVEVAQ